MITKLSIENFKGIRERVEIEVRPITLLFGPNSAGKSSILHALHYAAEIFERRNANADFTVTGGEFVDLGGFANLVHGHDLNRTVWLRFDMSDEDDFVERNFDSHDLDAINEILHIEEDMGSTANTIFNESDISVEIGVRWSELRGEPYVAEYRVYGLGDPWSRRVSDKNAERELVIAVSADPSSKRVHVSQLNSMHPSFLPPCEWEDREEDEDGNLPNIGPPHENPDEPVLSLALQKCRHCFLSLDSESQDASSAPLLLITGQDEAIPRPGEPFKFALRDKDEIVTAEEGTDDWSEQQQLYEVAKEVSEELSLVLTAPLELIEQYLRKFRYLGPIREVPPRNFMPSKSTDVTSASGRARWASGMGSWELLAGDAALTDRVNEWLDQQLKTGYSLEIKNFKELDLSDPLLVQLLTGRAFDETEGSRLSLEQLPTGSRLVLRPIDSEIDLEPADLGIGISQVVPVIVTALVGESGIQMIEQPELHLHPRLQAELGDLFVDAIQPPSRMEGDEDQYPYDYRNWEENHPCFLLETHSEHLILRLLRRIRETENGKAPANCQLRTNDLAIYYLNQEDGCTRVRQIDVDVKGEFIQPWPDDFFEIDFYERFN